MMNPSNSEEQQTSIKDQIKAIEEIEQEQLDVESTNCFRKKKERKRRRLTKWINDPYYSEGTTKRKPTIVGLKAFQKFDMRKEKLDSKICSLG